MADEQKKSAHEDVFSEDARVDVDTMTDEEIRMAASFTTNKVIRALIGDTTERKLARRILKLEKTDKAKIKEIEGRMRGEPNNQKTFKKLLKKLDENPQFYAPFFKQINERGEGIVYRLINNFDILEVNFEVFEDLLALQELWGSTKKIALVRQLKDQYEFNPNLFHKVSKTLLGQNDFFGTYSNFPEYLQKASDLLVGIAKEHPNDLRRFQTAYDFMNVIRLTSMFGTIISECDADFLSDQKSCDTCSVFYEEQKKVGHQEYLALKIRFTCIGFKHPEYKELLEDKDIFSRFNGYRPFIGDVNHILYILSLYKNGEAEKAAALLEHSDNFNHVGESENFEKAQPWILTLDTPESMIHGSGEKYSKALAVYLKLRDRDEAEAQAYLDAFKAVKGVSWGGNHFAYTLNLFEIYGDDLEALKVCTLWTKQFAADDADNQAAAKHFFHVYQRNPAEGMEYLQVFKDLVKTKTENNLFRSLCLYHEIYGEDLSRLKLIAEVHTCAKSNSAAKVLVKNYKEAPEEFERVWPKVNDSLEALNAEIGNDSLSEQIKYCVFDKIESIQAILNKVELMTKFVRSQPALLEEKNRSATQWLLNYFDQLVRDESEFALLETFLEKFESCEAGIENKELVVSTIKRVFEGPKKIKELTVRLQFMSNFVSACPVIFTDKKQAPFCNWILGRFDALIQDRNDFDFVGQILGKHGKAAEEIMAGYHDCLEKGALTRADKPLVLEFLDRFRVLSPAIISEYKKAKAEGRQEVYLASLNDLAGRMTGAGKLTDEERALSYYDDLLKEVYRNNVGHWTNLENNKTCEDRSKDLKFFKIRPRYEIDLFSQSEISLKEGEELDKTKTDELVQSITSLSTEFAEESYEPEKMQQALDRKVNEIFQLIQESCQIPAQECKRLTTEEKISLLVLDSMYGQSKVDEKTLKNLLIYYEFAYFEDVRDYIKGTTDRVSRAPNREYALLCELNTFFSDRIKEINKRVIQTGFKNIAIAKVVPLYFERLSTSAASLERKGKIERMQPDKLGLTDAFIKQIKKTIEGKTGKKYTVEQVREIISRYESITKGLESPASESTKQRTKAVYGQLRSQREKTRQLAQFITGTDLDPRRIHLGEINVAELLEAESNISGGVYDPAQFEAYTVQRALNLFQDEKGFLESELAKFISVTEIKKKTEGAPDGEKVSVLRQREVLNAYISKNKETANARMVGGVCVSGDNPGKVGKECMWNMENYFELVLEDPETHRCMGLVLLHAFPGDGKTLTASFNPSSTYLYKIDEKALFKGLLNTVATFAHENGFKRVCTSQNKAIRTNRTGGIFERAMDESIKELGKVYNFPDNKRFSHSPSYEMQSMDTIWEEGAAPALGS